jgi:exodeoxyribonuclease VII small subunit
MSAWPEGVEGAPESPAESVGASAGEPVERVQPGEPADRRQPTYEQAAARVEEIIRRLDSGEASLDETLALVSEGKALIELCASQLAAVGDALEELRLDELVSRLEREAGG